MNRTLAVLTLAGFALGTPSEAATGAAGFAELSANAAPTP